MAGYSSTPLAQKLGFKPDCRYRLVNAPPDFLAALDPLPDGAVLADADLDVIVFFTTALAALTADFARLARSLQPAGGLWIAWPKKASKVPTDLTEDIIRGVGLAAGLVDNKVCAVTDIWSGLRFVIRVQDRPAKRANPRRPT
jgi:hypothetical protein